MDSYEVPDPVCRPCPVCDGEGWCMIAVDARDTCCECHGDGFICEGDPY